MTKSFRQLIALIAISCICFLGQAQPMSEASKDNSKTAKPYRISTVGKQISIKCTRDIKSLLVWTSSGKRVVEQKSINTNSFSFRVPSNEKVFFLMVQLTDGKTYSEKIGVQ